MKKINKKIDKNSSKGITLIALVITIIVLLILAGVSISMITGQNSIMEKAQDAVVKTKNAEELEKVQLAVVNAIARGTTGGITRTILNEELDKMGLNQVPEGVAPWEVTGSQGTYTISANGNVEPHFTNGGTTPAGGGSSTPTTVALNGITTNPASETLTTGQTTQINVVYDPTNATDKAVTYTSNDTSVAIVDANGVVTAQGAGNTTITVAGSNSKTATFTVTVTPPPTIAEVTTIAQAKARNAVAVESGITTLKDAGNHDIKIPAKFHIASDSATDRSDGIVIEDHSGNQFVWIPVDNISSYTRTDFEKQDGNYSEYSETLDQNGDEYKSVNSNKGYYIGRFEAGDSVTGYTEDNTKNSLRASGASTTNAISIKKGCAPYNYISRTNAKTRAEAMDSEQGYSATTKLCSSYAWDTAINFIQGKESNYGSSSPQGNCKDVAKSYKDITGATQTVASGTSAGVIPTGQTTAVCNIYDMGGNVWEWTTEAYSNIYVSNSKRGGGYNYPYAAVPAGFRSSSDASAYDSIGFRVTLYLEP